MMLSEIVQFHQLVNLIRELNKPVEMSDDSLIALDDDIILLEQQNAELLDALKAFYVFKTKGYDQNVEPYNKECPVCHSDKPYHDGLCPKYKVDQVIAKAEGGK